MPITKPLLFAITCCAALASPVAAQVSSYDAASGVVTIPSVSAGAATFSGVTLKLRPGGPALVFDLTGYSGPAAVAYPGAASYDLTSGMLTLPAVKVGEQTYLDVRLQDGGGFVFTLQAAQPLAQSVVDEVTAFARSLEGLTATAIPATGAGRLALADACWLGDGRTRENFIADYDAHAAEYVQRDAFQIGRRYENIQVLALRHSTNPDGSARREIDVMWDIVYRDGAKFIGERSTLVSGSSAGTPGCSSAQTGPALRSLGNRRLARVQVRANNLREQRYSIASGDAIAPQVRYRREVEFAISDPMGRFTYAVLQGPGPGNTIGGTAYPFSMKLLSPRLLMNAPELRGKPGNFLNWQEEDNFRNCFFSNGTVPIAQFVDCAASGATNNAWGWGYTDTPNAAADDGFAAQGWVAGGVYRVDLYDDDGWKTINGQAGKTPVATYYATLDRLPYTFAAMAGKYPEINLGGQTGASILANALAATPAPLALTWTLPGRQPDGRVLHLNQAWEFHQGPKVGNPGTTLNPAYRSLNRVHPGSTATSGSLPVTPKLPDQASKTYTEYLLFFSEPGSLNTIRSRIQFQ